MFQTNYKKALTKEELQVFDNQWKKICEEMGNTYFPNHPMMDNYLIKGSMGEDVGTISFLKQNNQYSIVNSFYDFEEANLFPEGSVVVEMGKVSIKKELRGNIDHIKTLASCILEYVLENNVTHIVAFVNAGLVAAFRRIYRVPIYRVGKVHNLPSCKAYTVYVDCNKMLNNENKNFKELLNKTLNKTLSL